MDINTATDARKQTWTTHTHTHAHQWAKMQQETKGRTREHRRERLSEVLIMYVSATEAVLAVSTM